MSNQQLDPVTNLPEKKPQFDFSQIKFRDVSPIDMQKAYPIANDYLSGVDPNVTGDIYRQQLSDNQSGFEALRNTTGRLLGNIVPEVIRGFGYLEDVVTATPDGNALTDAMTNWIDSVNMELPLYSSPENKIINWENMSGLVNSMASFAVTGMGVGSVLGKLGTLGKAGAAVGQLGTATALTGIEGAMEANELLKNSYVQEYNKLTYENLEKGFDEETAMRMADQQAKSNVESAAKTAMLTNYINVALNLTSAGYFIRGGNPLDDIGRMVKKPSEFFTKNTLGKLAQEGVQESLEEGVNVFAGAAGKNQLAGGKYTFGEIWNNVDADELKASMVLGAIGGIGQTAISIGVKNMNTKWYKGKDTLLREKYAEQKDFIDKVSQTLNNPTDQSKNLLSTTHNLALLEQAKEREEAGDIEGANQIRKQAVAYNLYESFKNGTWKDFKDVIVNLSKKEELSEEQKASAEELIKDIDKNYNIYKNHISSNKESSAPFSMYYNRVVHGEIDKEHKKLSKEYLDMRSQREKEISEIAEMDISEKEKLDRTATVNQTYVPQLNEKGKEIADVHRKKIELQEKYFKLLDENIDSLNITSQAKSLYKKMSLNRQDLVYKATTEEDLDNALSKLQTPEEQDEFLQNAVDRQTENANPIDFTDEDSFAKTLTDRWKNKPALARSEKVEFAQKTGKPFTSIVDLAKDIFGINNQSQQVIDELEQQKLAELEAIDNTENYDGFVGKTSKGEDVIFRGDKYYILGGDNVIDEIQNARSRGNIDKKNRVKDFIKNKYNQLKKETSESAKNNVDDIKKSFEQKDEVVKEKIKESLEREEANTDPLETITDISQVKAGIKPSVETNSKNENIPILHWEVDKYGKPNSDMEEIFTEARNLLQTNELLDKTIFFESTEAELNRIGENFPNTSVKVDETNFTVYVVYYKDGNPNNKNVNNRIPLGKLRSDNYKSQGNQYTLDSSLLQIRQNIIASERTEIVSSGISTKINKILHGDIVTTDNFVSPLDILRQNEPLILGVATNKGGAMDLDFNGFPIDKSELMYNPTKLVNGGVYMMIKTADDKYIPLMLRVNKVNDLDVDQRKNRIIELVNSLEDPKTSIAEVKKELNNLVHYISNINRTESGEIKFLSYRNIDPTTGRNTKSTKDFIVSKERFIEILLNDLAKVDRKSINKGTYNAQLAGIGAIKTNLSNRRFTLGNIRFDLPTSPELERKDTTETNPKEPILQEPTEPSVKITAAEALQDGISIQMNEDEELTPEELEAIEKSDRKKDNTFSDEALLSLFPGLDYSDIGFFKALKADMDNNYDVNNLRTDDGQYYIIKGERYFRVSNVLPKKVFLESRKGGNVSTDVGTKVDDLARRLLNNEKVEKPEFMTKAAFEDLKTIIDELKDNVFDYENNSVIPDRVIVHHDFGKGIGKIAGELDVLVVSGTGVSIFDFKTANSFGDYEENYRKGHSMQLSAYANLISNQFNVPIEKLGIIKLEVNYDSKGNIIGIVNDGVANIQYDTEVEKYIPRVKQESILDKEETGTNLQNMGQAASAIANALVDKFIEEIEKGTFFSSKKEVVDELLEDPRLIGYKIEETSKVFAGKTVNGYTIIKTEEVQSDLEAKKADIEKRRQETLEYGIEDVEGWEKEEEKFAGRYYTKFLPKVNSYDYILIYGFSEEDILNKINAKYDAELAASEQPVEKQQEAPLSNEEKLASLGKSKKTFKKPTTSEKESTPEVIKPAVEVIKNNIEVIVKEEVTKEEIKEVAEETNTTQEEASKIIADEVKNELNNKPRKFTGKAVTKVVKRITSIITKSFVALLIYTNLTGFSAPNAKHNLNTPIELATSILPDSYQQSAIRGFTKMGLYNPSVYESKIDVSKVKERETVETENFEQYKKENTFTEILQTVKDSHYKARKNASDSLVSVRNQYFNKDGFEYIAGSQNSRSEDGDKYNNALGVIHFMILDDQGVDVSVRTDSTTLKQASDQFKKRIGNDIKLTDYIPVFNRNGERVTVKYKIASEVNENDLVITKLINYNFGDIDFNSKIKAPDFKGGIFNLTDKKGKILPSFVFTNKKAFSRNSGAGVVFLFKDNKGNLIARDFSGSIELFQKEGESIAKQFNIPLSSITVGAYDAGSYTAKPKANKDGVLEQAQWDGYNKLHPNSGGALIIPRRNRKTNKYGNRKVQKELDNLKRILPKSIDTKVVEEIERIGDITTYGIYEDAAITLIENPEIGTGYHEAVHAVVDIILSPNEKYLLLKEIEKTYKPTLTEMENYKRLYPTASTKELYEIALEEKLAEDFQFFAVTKDTKNGGKHSVSLFNRIKYWVENIFKKHNNKITVDKFFNKLYDGGYSSKKPYKNKMGNKFAMFNANKMSPFEKIKRGENLLYFYTEILNEFKRNEAFQGYSSAAIINEVGFKNLVNIIATRIVQDRNAAKEIEDAEFREFLLNKYDNFLNNFVDFENTDFTNLKDIGGELDFLSGLDTVADFAVNLDLPLMINFINSLSKFGIAIKITKTQEVITDKQPVEQFTAIEKELNDEQLEDTSIEEIDNEERRSIETWQTKADEISSEKSFSAELKYQLSTITKPISENDDLDYNTFESYLTVRNFLIENLANTYTIEEMMKKLEKLAPLHTYSNVIYEKALENESFRTNLFVYIASKAESDYLIVKEIEEGNLKVFRSNRNNLTSLIVEDLKAFFSNSKMLLGKEENGVKQVNLEEAKNFNSRMNEFLKLFKDNTNYTKDNATLIAKDELLNSFVELLREYSIDITLDQAKALAKSGKGELFKLVDLLYFISVYLKDGKNVLSPNVGEDISEGTTLEKLAKILIPVTQHKSEKSMTTVNNTVKFTHSNSSFIKKHIVELTTNNELLDRYLEDPFYSESFILKEIKEQSEGAMKFAYLPMDGLSTLNKSVDFSNMEPYDLETVTISAFINNGRSTAFYRAPVFSDSPSNGFIAYSKVTNASESSEFWNKVYSVVLQEYNRMVFVNNNKDEMFEIKNVKARYNKYHLSPFMNNVKLNNDIKSEEGKNEVIEIAKAYYAEQFEKEMRRYFQMKIVEYNSVGKLVSIPLGFQGRIHKNSQYDGLLDNLKDYFYNTKLVNSQTISLFSGDPMFYKTDNDWSKRNKQVVSPVLYGDETRVRPNYEVISIKDIEVDLTKNEEFVSNLNKIFENHPLKNKIISAYVTTSLTDAQSFITIDRYKEVLTMFDRWTNKHEKMYKKIKNNENLLDEEIVKIYQDYFDLFAPIKPFDFHHRFSLNVNGKNLKYITPFQAKRAEYVLLPQMARNNEVLSKYLNVLEAVERKGNTAVINFNTAIKVGEHNTYDSIDAIDGDLKSGNIKTVELSNKNYGLQVEVPSHFLEDMNNFGSQIMKIISADIDSEFQYDTSMYPEIAKLFPDGVASHEDLRSLYKQLIANNLKKDFNTLKGEMNNIKNLKKLLTRAGIQNQLQDDYFKVLGSQESDQFNLPLWFPPFGKTNESVLHSLLRNRVVKQKFPGASLVNVSSVGYSDDLKIKFNEDGSLKHFEARLPYWTKKYFNKFINLNTGEIEIKQLEDLIRKDIEATNLNLTEKQVDVEVDNKMSSIFEIIAYRIPTEHKHSMFKIKVVGFTHPLAAGAIQLPTAATTISGFDFDVDKLYCLFPTFDNKKSKEKGFPVRYDYTLNQVLDTNASNQVRYNAILDIMKAFLSTKEAAQQIFEPSSFDDLKENAHRIYISSLGYKDAFTLPYSKVKSIIDNEEKDLTNPSTQSNYIELNRVGKALIGFFANHNTCHSFAQTTSLQLKKLVVRFNNTEFYQLNGIKDQNNTLISKTLGGSIAASTDNAKDPIASFMNLNLFTVDKYALLYRLGVAKTTAQLFLSQHIIKELAASVTKGGNTESALQKTLEAYDKFYNETYLNNPNFADQWKMPVRKEFYDFSDSTLKELLLRSYEVNQSKDKLDDLLNQQRLEKDENKKKELLEIYQKEKAKHYSDHWKFYNAQYLVLHNFQKIIKPATELGNLSGAIKVDNVSNRSNLSDIETTSLKFFKINDIESLSGVEDFFEDTLLGAYYDYGLRNAKELFSKFFPYLEDGFANIKNVLIDRLKLKENSKNLQRVNYLILSALASDFEFFADLSTSANSTRTIVMDRLPDMLHEYIEENHSIKGKEKYVSLLRRFAVRERKFESVEFNSIEFYKNGLNSTDRQLYSDIIEEMLNEPDGSKERLIANNLVRYAFYKSGFTSDAISFSTMIPVSFWMNLRSFKGELFSDYLTNKVNDLNRNQDMQEDLIDKIYLNTIARPDTYSTPSKINFSVVESNPLLGATLISFSGSQITNILTKQGKRAIFDKELNLTENSFTPYVYDKEKKKLYKKVPGFKGTEISEVVYRLVPRKGLGPYSIELGNEKLSNFSKALNGFDEEFHSDLSYANTYFNNKYSLDEIDKIKTYSSDTVQESLSVEEKAAPEKDRKQLNEEMDQVFRKNKVKKVTDNDEKKQTNQLELFAEQEDFKLDDSVYEDEENSGSIASSMNDDDFFGMFGNDVESVEQKNSEIINYFIDNFDNLTDKQKEELNKVGLTTVEDIRKVNSSSNVIEELTRIKCL